MNSYNFSPEAKKVKLTIDSGESIFKDLVVNTLCLLLDYDGCLVQANKLGNDIKTTPDKLYNRILEKIKENKYTHVYVICASNRQDYEKDRYNMTNNKNGSAFTALPLFTERLKELTSELDYPVIVKFIPILTADIYQKNKIGTEMTKSSYDNIGTPFQQSS